MKVGAESKLSIALAYLSTLQGDLIRKEGVTGATVDELEYMIKLSRNITKHASALHRKRLNVRSQRARPRNS